LTNTKPIYADVILHIAIFSRVIFVYYVQCRVLSYLYLYYSSIDKDPDAMNCCPILDLKLLRSLEDIPNAAHEFASLRWADLLCKNT